MVAPGIFAPTTTSIGRFGCHADPRAAFTFYKKSTITRNMINIFCKIFDFFKPQPRPVVPFKTQEQYIDAIKIVDELWETESRKSRQQSPEFHDLVDRVILWETTHDIED